MSTPPLVAASLDPHNAIDTLVTAYQVHGGMFTLAGQDPPLVCCVGDAAAGQMLRGERGNLIVHNTPVVHELFGRAVFNLADAEHAAARRLLRTGLTRAAVAGYASTLVGLAISSVNRWAAAATVELSAVTHEFTMAACLSVVAGLPPDEHVDAAALFESFVAATAIASLDRSDPCFRTGLEAAAGLRNLLRDRLTHTDTANNPDVASRLAAARDTDRQDLPDHLLAMLIAARETTASLIVWAIVELAAHPALVAQLRHEAAESLRDPRQLPLANKLPGLRTLLTEIERLHSPNAISVRETLREYSICGHDLPAGTLVAYSPAANHLLPEQWGNPTKFQPDRHHRRRQGATAQLWTFGKGVHMCLGRELAQVMTLAVVAALIADHTIEVERVPRRVRCLPVKAPSGPITARIRRLGPAAGKGLS